MNLLVVLSRARVRRRACACRDESAGLDGIIRTLISAFGQVDIIALGEAHGRRLDSDSRIALVRHPDFAKKVRSIVVEFGSTTEQSTLDRYIRGENVSRAKFEQVWKTTTQPGPQIWENPIYADFFAAVRAVNSRLPADARVRVFGGDPSPVPARPPPSPFQRRKCFRSTVKPWLFMAPRTSIGTRPAITFLAWATTSESRGCWKSIIPVELSW